MSRRFLGAAAAVVTAALAALVLAAAPASAGGWAMSSLDPMTVPAAGEEVTVGFTIRQHGVTPVNPDEEGGAPVEVVVRPTAGAETVFPARPEGPTGHYVATVTFPEAGEVSWEIRQGWFGPHELGTIAVATSGATAAKGPAAKAASAPPEAAPAGAGASTPSWPLAARLGTTLLALAAAGVVAADLWRSRRRPVRPTEVVPL